MDSARMVATELLPAIDVVKADPADNVYLATALAGGARSVVTGNTRHLTPLDGYAGLRIAVPAVFLAELDAQG
jgi:predicted nucleic acid-binding protein